METVPAPPSSPKYREPSAYCMSESNRPSQASKAPSAATAGGFYPYCPSPPGRPPDSREVAVRFRDRRPDCTRLAPSGRFNGQVDICYAQRAGDRDGRDAGPCFLGETTVPLCSNLALGSAPAACRDRNGIRTHRITSLLKTPPFHSLR